MNEQAEVILTAEERRLAAEEKRLALEERAVDLENKKLQNKKLRGEIDQVRLKDEDKTAHNRRKFKALQDQRPENMYAETRKTCNHMQGGKGRESLLSGRGSGDNAAIIQIKLPTGDVLIRCPRCRKLWLPPWEANFYFGKDGNWLAKEEGGKFDKVAFKAAQDEYNTVYNLPTDSARVILPQYRWAKGGKPLNREVSYRYVQMFESPATVYYEAKRFQDAAAASKTKE